MSKKQPITEAGLAMLFEGLQSIVDKNDLDLKEGAISQEEFNAVEAACKEAAEILMRVINTGIKEGTLPPFNTPNQA